MELRDKAGRFCPLAVISVAQRLMDANGEASIRLQSSWAELIEKGQTCTRDGSLRHPGWVPIWGEKRAGSRGADGPESHRSAAIYISDVCAWFYRENEQR